MLYFSSSPLTYTVQLTHMHAQVHMCVYTCVCASLLQVSLLIPAPISLLPTFLVPYLTFLLQVVFMPGHHYESHGDRGFHGGETPPVLDAGAIAESPFPPEGPVQ